jgi:proton-dependent oligopeptide transporter, POT family
MSTHTHTRTPAFIIILKLFSALPFAIFYSSLQLYLLKVGFHKDIATSLVGSVLALSFGSSLIGGYLGGRNISYRSFFLFSIICQALGCFAFSSNNHSLILWFICLFLLGSTGINVSLNMMLTQCYKPDDYSREKAFFLFYMSLNLGYLLGYTLAGYYGNLNQYHKLPMIVSSLAGITVFFTLFRWHLFGNSSKHESSPHSIVNHLPAILVLIIFYFCIRLLLNTPQITNAAIIGVWTLGSLIMLTILLRYYKNQRKEILAFYILLIAALAFWSAYLLAPMALIVFIKHHVNLNAFGINIAPQWVQNINTLMIIAGATLLGAKSKRKSFHPLAIIKQFSLGLILLGSGFLCLKIGIDFTSPTSKLAFSWVILSYVLQSLGELLIGPIGYSLVGRLIPKQHQAIMMGIWVTLLGVGGAIASKLSILAPYLQAHLTRTLGVYGQFFAYIGLGAITVSAVIYLISKQIIKPHVTLSKLDTQ